MSDGHSQARLFLLSPAFAGGKRAAILYNRDADFPLARRLHHGEGITLGEAFSFMSGLYFRGKLAYGRRFAADPAHLQVITTNQGLISPDRYVTAAELRDFGTVEIEAEDPRYRDPLVRSLRALDGGHEVVLLGSVATSKYLTPLQEELGDRLHFPAAFVGRGDMSRGALMLRAAASGVELEYQPVAGAVRHGPRAGRVGDQ
jgi:hypothetical protein